MHAAAQAGGALRASRRRAPTAALAAAAALAALLGTAGSAQAAIGRICAERAIIREKPGGLVIGVLERDDRVRVVKRSGDKVWVRVSVDLPAVGWIKSGALCGR
jgi:hypothetical protein